MKTKVRERLIVKEDSDISIVVGNVVIKIVFGCALAIGIISLASLIGGAVAVGGPVALFKAMVLTL